MGEQQTPNLMEALKQSLRNAKLGEPTPPAAPQPETQECDEYEVCGCGSSDDGHCMYCLKPILDHATVSRADVEEIHRRLQFAKQRVEALVEALQRIDRRLSGVIAGDGIGLAHEAQDIARTALRSSKP